MKAIETKYKGYRFRSRLEARWAVFFESLGWKWEYEPEGFELESGWYLPDFRINDHLWVEIKGKKPTENEKLRLIDVCYDTGMDGFFLTSIPDPDSCCIGVVDEFVYSVRGHYMDHGYMNWIMTDLAEFIDSIYETDYLATIDHDFTRIEVLEKDMEYYLGKYGKPHPHRYSKGVISSFELDDSDNSLRLAVTKARSSRFEHGETP